MTLVGNIYSHLNTIYFNEDFKQTKKIQYNMVLFKDTPLMLTYLSFSYNHSINGYKVETMAIHLAL